MPISNKQPHTFKMGSVKFYALFLKYEQVFEEEVIKAEVTRHTKDEVIAEVKRKYEAGELDPEQIETRETTYTGFHFFLFDQDGYVWAQLTNTNDQSVGSICGSLRGKRVWEAETDKVYYEPLERDRWLENHSPDVWYALEAFREGIGLNLFAFYKANEELKKEED